MGCLVWKHTVWLKDHRMGSAKQNRDFGMPGKGLGVRYFYFSYYYFSAVCPVAGEV